MKGKDVVALHALCTVLTTLFASALLVTATETGVFSAILSPMFLLVAAFAFASMMLYVLHQRKEAGTATWFTSEDIVSGGLVGLLCAGGCAILPALLGLLPGGRTFVWGLTGFIQGLAFLILVLTALYVDVDGPRPKKVA